MRECRSRRGQPSAEPLEDRRLLSAVVPSVGTGSATIAQLTHLPFTNQYLGPRGTTAFDGRLYYLEANPSTRSTAVFRAGVVPGQAGA